MRISERYIKMCEKAEEIQREWKPKMGDRYWNTLWRVLPENYPEILCSGSFVKGDLKEKVKNIWLPTQEQLQGMLTNNAFWYYQGSDCLNREMARVYGSLYAQGYFETGNEFWLAYVMWKKYQKIWDDKKEEWVKGGIHEV